MYNCVALQDIRLEVSLTLLSPYDVSHQENLSKITWSLAKNLEVIEITRQKMKIGLSRKE